MKLDTSALVSKSLRLGFREPRLWAFGLLMMAIGFLQHWAFPRGPTSPNAPIYLLSLFGEQLARTALLIGLSRQCLAVVRGQRPVARDAFATVGKNWLSIVLFSLLLWVIDQAAARSMALAKGDLMPIWFPLLFIWTTIYMVLPVLARETLGPVAAMRRAMQILEPVCRARLRGLFGIGLRFLLPFMLVVVLLAELPKLADVDTRPVGMFLHYASMLFFAIMITCDQLFDVSVYLAASEGQGDRAAA